LQTLNIHIGIKYIFDESYTIKEILFNPEDRMIKNDYFSYQVLENTNCCLFSQIFISSELKIYPCPYLRDFILGDITNGSKDLYKVFREDKYREFWFLCKSKISGCELCKYRLQCLDCRAVEFTVTKDLYKEYYCKIASQLK